jgi:hypothetical protein
MNESNILIEKNQKANTHIILNNTQTNVKINKSNIFKKQSRDKYIIFAIRIIIFIILYSLIIIKFKDNLKRKKRKNIIKKINRNSVYKIDEIYKNIESYEIKHNKMECNALDPINIFKKRLTSTSTILCSNDDSNHICFKDGNDLFVARNGASCEFKNVIIDPSKWRADNNIYKGPMDPNNRGCPLLSEGFFNIQCKSGEKNNYSGYDFIYNNYFNGWNYEYKNYEKEKEQLEELAPGKTVFFISRNQDSPNLYHGGSEFVNALAIMYLMNLNPKDIQIVFLESILIMDDPFYDLYKELIGRGGEPIHIKNLTKKYLVSKGVHIPINWDSPCFIRSEVPECINHPTKTYYLYNMLIDKYISPDNYTDIISNNNKNNSEIFYYPETIINEITKNKNSFNKILTFQWRRVWPKGRKGQYRILGNGPELADKLSSLLPKNILLRLIDTARLPINQQISIMRNTDYFVGIHGAGLSLSIFAPQNCIYHEVLHVPNMNGLELFAALSGHKVYKDIIAANVKYIDGNENIFFNVDEFAKVVISHLKESNLM